ncbi:FMN-dependent NADH-azoreductase [Corallincola platygyrae]|uniref:FMN dependent NADH:quinone oxidoreductase n=1 Tax=Corallincola platygyrae TaxID=1193278 RepID=A0ABW4XU12_9GAMM
MKKLLVVKSSILADNSQSSRLADLYAEAWLKANLDGEVSVRDLGAEPIPHLDGNTLGAWATPAEEQTAEQRELAQRSDLLIEEVMSADVIVIGMPMYNFGVPSSFKAWIDHIARAGVTFRYTENGPEGLVKNTRAVVAAARGGMYQGTPKDTQTVYLRDVLGFLGISDVEFAYAEGLAMGEEGAKIAIEAAERRLNELV